MKQMADLKNQRTKEESRLVAKVTKEEKDQLAAEKDHIIVIALMATVTEHLAAAIVHLVEVQIEEKELSERERENNSLKNIKRITEMLSFLYAHNYKILQKGVSLDN